MNFIAHLCDQPLLSVATVLIPGENAAKKPNYKHTGAEGSIDLCHIKENGKPPAGDRRSSSQGEPMNPWN
jgi:hypothetical protein